MFFLLALSSANPTSDLSKTGCITEPAPSSVGPHAKSRYLFGSSPPPYEQSGLSLQAFVLNPYIIDARSLSGSLLRLF